MRYGSFWKIGLLAMTILALSGASQCTKDVAIDFVVNAQSEATFEARGANDFGSDEYDLMQDLDLATIATDYGVDVEKIEQVTFRGISYKVVRADPDPTRRIENGLLEIQFRNTPGDVLSYPLVPLGTNFGTAPDDPGAPRSAGAVTDWIDITTLVDAAGVAQINQFLSRVLTSLKSGAPAAGTVVFYHWTGDSVPLGNTDFDWRVQVTLNVITAVDAEVPDF
ncbi:MAG: hypothetical protein ACRDGR_02375 [bacterium]